MTELTKTRTRAVLDDAITAKPQASPIQDYLATLCFRLANMDEGEVASYIPELKKAHPDWFGISIATVDGRLYSVGDVERRFTIQSVSKPLMYGYALREYGREFVLNHVGVEPTGEVFNSIVLDEEHNRPFNPMVNAGAIAVAELMKGVTQEEREARLVALFSQFAGRPLTINDEVFRSEKATGHRNRAIAHMMLNTAMIERDPEDLLDLYFKQCSIDVTCEDLAMMAATLAHDGVNPKTNEVVLAPDHVRDVLTVMHTCGMYNYAGQWAFEVGMPAKSGVSGGIIAVIPGQIGIGVFSPPLDQHGNSVRAVQVCKAISEEFSLHAFNNSASVQSVVRREYQGDRVKSHRLRTPLERNKLLQEGRRISVLEAQGPLFFGSVEQLIRRVGTTAATCKYIIIDFKRVQSADVAAVKLLCHMIEALADEPCHILMTHLLPDGLLAPLYDQLSNLANGADTVQIFDDTDTALEWCENRILQALTDHTDHTKFALSKLEIFQGLTVEEIHELESIIQAFHFEKGDVILREGDAARLFFVVARGSVSVYLKVSGRRKRRVACMGPGLTFGEMALLDGGARSAEIVADENVICYGLAVEAIRELSVAHPNIMITMLTNLAKDFSERLRHGNDEIRALE